MTNRLQKLQALGAPTALKATGFRRELMNLANRDPDGWMWIDDIKYLSAIPAAYEIKARDAGRREIHIYEIESSRQVPSWKIAQYAWIADGDGPRCILHVFDRWGNERVINNDRLECMW